MIDKAKPPSDKQVRFEQSLYCGDPNCVHCKRNGRCMLLRLISYSPFFIADSRRSQVVFFLLLLILPLNGPLRAQQGNETRGPLSTKGSQPPAPDVPPTGYGVPDVSGRAQNDASEAANMMAHVNEVQLQKDSKALAELCASISAEMNAIQRGALPKDVVEKLKIVEKLSRRVREESTRSTQANQH